MLANAATTHFGYQTYTNAESGTQISEGYEDALQIGKDDVKVNFEKVDAQGSVSSVSASENVNVTAGADTLRATYSYTLGDKEVSYKVTGITFVLNLLDANGDSVEAADEDAPITLSANLTVKIYQNGELVGSTTTPKESTFSSYTPKFSLSGPGLTEVVTTGDFEIEVDINGAEATNNSVSSYTFKITSMTLNGKTVAPSTPDTPVTPPVPEPTTATLSLLALAGLAACRRRK